jgi:hypothetical protein
MSRLSRRVINVDTNREYDTYDPEDFDGSMLEFRVDGFQNLVIEALNLERNDFVAIYRVGVWNWVKWGDADEDD